MSWTVEIRQQDRTLLRVSATKVLLPLKDEERTQAFSALMDALSLLCGVKLPVATEAETDQCCLTTTQCDDHRKSGVVVPLRLR